MSAAPRRILLMQHHHLGDVILTTPAIRAVRRAFPNASIDFFTGSLGAQALAGNPYLDRILVRPSLWSVYRTGYDAVVDFHSVPRTARVVAASRGKQRIGLRGRGPRNFAYSILLPRENESVYMGLQKLRMLAPLGVDVDVTDLHLDVALDAEHHAWATEALRKNKLTIGRVVAISPVAKHPFKQWGARNWAIVADALADSGSQILITSGPGEEEQAEAVAKLMKHEAVWQYGPTSVRQLAALYSKCNAWLGNDGGPKHIAAAAGTPTVTVYRRNLGGVWSDPSDPKQIAINSLGQTLENIQPEQVIDAARRIPQRSNA